ncbi:hypothetical protein ANO14919_078630 [Xylariales sp. No.14919]|nr:hypothetical protein ANO14919_078630 [Xylariales sp. No.14919]
MLAQLLIFVLLWAFNASTAINPDIHVFTIITVVCTLVGCLALS